MAVRAIDDAIKHGGLLKKAITQLVLNFEMAGRQAKSTWMGHLLTCIRKTWPQFRVLVAPTIEMRGLPSPLRDVKIGRQYTSAACVAHWRRRQVKLMRRGLVFLPPRFHILQNHFKTLASRQQCRQRGPPRLQTIIRSYFSEAHCWHRDVPMYAAGVQRNGRFRPRQCTSSPMAVSSVYTRF